MRVTSMNLRPLLMTVATASLILAASMPSTRAAGDYTDPVPTCRKGEVWDAKAKKCVKRTSAIPDSDLTPYAYALAQAERFEEALQVLDSLKDPNTAKALNYRGYVTRKLGRVDEGIGYYLRSVALDPRDPLVREYLGEAYVSKGEPALARDQLATIRGLCGTDCREYRNLAEALDSLPKA